MMASPEAHVSNQHPCLRTHPDVQTGRPPAGFRAVREGGGVVVVDDVLGLVRTEASFSRCYSPSRTSKGAARLKMLHQVTRRTVSVCHSVQIFFSVSRRLLHRRKPASPSPGRLRKALPIPPKALFASAGSWHGALPPLHHYTFAANARQSLS